MSNSKKIYHSCTAIIPRWMIFKKLFSNFSSILSIKRLKFEKFIRQIMVTITNPSIFIDKWFLKIRHTTSVIQRRKFQSVNVLLCLESFVNLFVNQSEREKICYLNADDFLLDHSISIFNQRFLLDDCDSHTRHFYESKYSSLNAMYSNEKNLSC